MDAASNNLSVLHISSADYWRGGEQQVAYLMQELRKAGIRQTLLCPRHSALQEFCQANQFSHYTVRKSALLNYYTWPAGIARICKKESITLIHAHESNAHSFAVLANDLFGKHIKLAVSRRVVFPIRKKKFTLYKYNHPLLRKIFCDAEAVKAVLQPYVRDQHKLVVIPPAVDIKKFGSAPVASLLREEYHLTGDTRLIGNIAALTKEKDIFTFVDTADVFLQQHPDFQAAFFLIGEGKLRNRLEAYAQEKGVAGKIIFTGFRKDIVQILPQLDILLMTSLSESINTSLLDAMACGVPVVTTKAGGNAELVKHGETGMLAELKDAPKLADNIWKILSDDRLRDKLIGNGRKAVENYSVEVTGKKILNEYLLI